MGRSSSIRGLVGGMVLTFGTGATFLASGAPDAGAAIAPVAHAGGAILATTPNGKGFWGVDVGGDVLPFPPGVPPAPSATPFFGSPTSIGLPFQSAYVGITATPDGKGYWVASAGGGIFSFGDAAGRFFGSPQSILADEAKHPTCPTKPKCPPPALTAPIVGIAATPDGKGYWVAGGDGGIFTFGDARFHGSLPGEHVQPNRPIVGITATPDGGGYWLYSADGGVFTFGDARFSGAAAQFHPDVPVVGLAARSDSGYWMVDTKGEVFSFGDAPSRGNPSVTGAIGIVADPDGSGYTVVDLDGVGHHA